MTARVYVCVVDSCNLGWKQALVVDVGMGKNEREGEGVEREGCEEYIGQQYRLELQSE